MDAGWVGPVANAMWVEGVEWEAMVFQQVGGHGTLEGR